MVLKRLKATELVTEIISAFTISVLLIPESIAFAFILGLAPAVGIHSTMIMSLVTAVLGGCPALVSGSTAAVATSLVGVKTLLGDEYIFLSVILGGIIQIVMGLTNLYKYIFEIPASVSSGFLIALGLLIAHAQINNFKDEKGNFLKRDILDITILLTMVSTVITIFGLIIFKFQHLSKSFMNLPGGLLSIVLLYMLHAIFGDDLPVQTIGNRGDLGATLPTFHLPKVEWSLMTFLKVLPFSIGMAIAGLTESLFMVKEASTLFNVPETPLQDCIAQGIANILSGACGGIGGCVLVGQSKFNIENGSTTRFSSICTSLFFTFFVLFFSSSIKEIPMPALIGIMFAIAFKSGDWQSLNKKFDKEWITTLFTSVVGFFTGNLAGGVILGSLLHNFLV